MSYTINFSLSAIGMNASTTCSAFGRSWYFSTVQQAKIPIIGIKAGSKSIAGNGGLVPNALIYASSSIESPVFTYELSRSSELDSESELESESEPKEMIR